MQLEVFAADRWAAEVADRWRQRLTATPAIKVCLPTGATPRPVYRKIAPGGMGDARLFLLDEFGGLPPGHPGRCDSMIRRDLLDLLPEVPAAFDRIDVDAPDLAAECRRYDEAVTAGRLDLVLLGLGSNGHIGLNEPGSPPDSPTRVVELHPSTRRSARAYGEGDDAPTWGATIGMAALLSAGEVWLLVTGAHKKAVLGATLTGPIGIDVPASLLRDHPNAVVLADDDAAPAPHHHGW